MPEYTYHHVHLISHDAMAAGKYYKKMFGAEITESKGANGLPRCDMNVGGQTILISTDPELKGGQSKGGPNQQLGLDHIGLRVDDMESAAIELKELGAEFSLEPRDIGSNVKIAFVRGPDNVPIELVQYG